MIGSRKQRGGDEYIFVDGKAMRADEAVRIQLTAADTAAVPGQAAADREAAREGKRKWNAQRAFRELDSGNAFEVSDEYLVSLRGATSLFQDDKRKTRRLVIVLCTLLVLLTMASLCISYNYTATFYSPLTVAQTLVHKVYLSVGYIFHLSYWNIMSDNDAANAINGYADILKRGNITFTTIVCGFLLSVAGMLYQNCFKNPIASPTMLGVSSGVRIGTIVLVLTFGVNALNYEGLRYIYCYIGGIIILLGVMGFSKLMAGKGRDINVADMLICGSIFSQLLQVFSQYVLTYILSDEEWEVFYELTQGARNTVTEWYGILFLFIIIAVSIVPVIMARFRINAVAFDDSEAKLLGVDPSRLRVFVLCMGTLAILAAQIHVGVISMVSLVVPFIVRYIVGSEFRKQLIGNMLLGPMMLLVCRDVCSLFTFAGTSPSLNMVVGFVALPVYIWMMALGRKGWE